MRKTRLKNHHNSFALLRLAVAILIAVGITVAIILSISKQPGTAIYNLFLGPLQSKRHFFNVLESSIPLMFTGLALSIVFKSGNFSMIADGALYMGGTIAAAIAIKLALPTGLHPIVMILAGALVGGIIGSIPAILKVKCHANELVTSLMLNNVFFFSGIYIINKYLIDRSAGTFASLKYQPTSSLGNIVSGTRLHYGFFIALLVAGLLYILLYKTKFGYEIRLVGSNLEFAKHTGINIGKVIILTQMLAGAIAGMGGAVEQAGMYQRFNWQDSPTYAWDGVIITILAGNNPKLVPVAAFFLAYIRVGADLMSRRSDVQNELVAIVQAVLILFITAERFLAIVKQRQESKKALSSYGE